MVITLPEINTGDFSFGDDDIIDLQASIPLEWDTWLQTYWPHRYTSSFADHHRLFWQHIETIEDDTKASAYFLILSRGGGKDSNMEGAVVRLGSYSKRKFCLYVRATQNLANKTVQSIGSMLESSQFARDYPTMANRQLTKYGHSRGWKADMLRCANGFGIVGLGLDVSVRGLRLDELRPDLIVFSDIDDRTDTLETIKKKEEIIRNDILPAGSSNTAIIGIQNLIRYNGIFHKITTGKADYLLDRVVNGPYPAIDDLEYERLPSGKYRITKGTPTWEGQSIAICEGQINDWGIDSFLTEAQHQVHKRTGLVYHAYNQDERVLSSDILKLDIEGLYHSHDFGAVNHTFGIWAKVSDAYYLIYEEKIQPDTSANRASKMIAKLDGYGLKVVSGWGGAKSERQQRLDFRQAGLEIRPPPFSDVEGQINYGNEMLSDKTLVICSDMVYTIDDLMNCVRDDKEGIQDKSKYHFADMVRYFATGIKYL